jgi:hypothetical protein
VQGLALGNEPGHRPYRLLDRDFRVDPMQIVEVDVVGAQPPQRRLACHLHILGTPIQMAPAIGEYEAEVGRQTDLITPARQGMSHKPLIGSVRIRVSSIEKEHSELER